MLKSPMPSTMATWLKRARDSIEINQIKKIFKTVFLSPPEALPINLDYALENIPKKNTYLPYYRKLCI